MPEELDFTETATVWFKGRNGEIKELRVKIVMDPSQRKFSFEDIQLLAKKISEQLRAE
jgi:hypothetical protein